MEFAARLNILTGDNGLGKTLAMNIEWWALARTWAGLPAAPGADGTVTPEIGFGLSRKHGNSRDFLKDHAHVIGPRQQ